MLKWLLEVWDIPNEVEILEKNGIILKNELLNYQLSISQLSSSRKLALKILPSPNIKNTLPRAVQCSSTGCSSLERLPSPDWDSSTTYHDILY